MRRFEWSNLRQSFINSLPLQVVVCGLLLTFSISGYVYYSGYEKEELQFENEVTHVEQSVSETLNTYLALLNAARGYVYTHDTIDRANFSEFVSELALRERYPGLQGIGYIAGVDAEQKEAVEQAQELQGFTDFTIHPSEPPRRYYPILYLEPLDQRNEVALGFDMYSQEVRRSAMERARDSGSAILSGKVTLVQEPLVNRQPGFLLFLPVYTQNRTPQEVSGRQELLEGYVYAPLRATDFFTAVFENTDAPNVNMTIYDGESQDEAQLLYEYNPDPNYKPRFSTTRTFVMGDHTWTTVYKSKASSDITSERSLVPMLIISGLGITTLLYFVSRSLVRARVQAEAFQQDLLQSKQALQTSEERMRLIVEGLKDLAIITLDASGAVTSWNPGADRFFGYTEREILGKSYNLFFTPNERRANKPQRDLKQVLAAGSLEFERMMIRKNGTRFWANGLMSALYDSNNKLRGVAVVVQDVSVRKRSEVLLRKQESVSQAVMSSLTDLIAVLDRSGTIVSSNESWNNFMLQLPETPGRHRNQVGDNYLRQLEKSIEGPSSEYAKKAADGIHSVLRGDVGEFILECPVEYQSDMIWFLLTVTALKHEEGGVVISITNITAIKKLDQQKNEFLSVVSHELKTPITSVRAYAQVLQKLVGIDGKTRETSITTKIVTQLDKMQLLISDLLDLSKIEAGKLRLNEQVFQLDELVFEVAEELQLISETHAIRFTSKVPVSVHADRDRIGQVLTNLIDNAIKYSPDSDTVELECRVEGKNAIVSVHDFGMGISKKDQKRLFQRFFRANQVTVGTVFPGLGLGLYICAEIVQRSGGTLKVESEVGKGSVFTISLPLVPPPNPTKKTKTSVK